MKIAIIFFSETGNTEKVAQFIREGATNVADTEVRLFNLKHEYAVDESYINECDAVVFGSPTYAANMCWQICKWLGSKFTVKLGGKLGAVFSTENSPNGGGAELAIMSTVSLMLTRGMLVYSSGNEFGRPTIHIGPTVVRDRTDEMHELCTLFGQRIAQKAHSLFDGSSNA